MAENSKIENGMSHSPNGQYVALCEYEKLKAELEELRKDKVRLDWLEGQKFGKDCLNYIGNTAREAIDNAMRGEK